jgi:hypothetical protein
MEALGELVRGVEYRHELDIPVPRMVVVDAFRRVGATVRSRKWNKVDATEIAIHGIIMTMTDDNALHLASTRTVELDTWIRQVIGAALPDTLTITKGRGEAIYSCEPLRLTTTSTEQGRAITDATRVMLAEGPRCILLDGRPGVGKTTMAQEIARELNIGRVALVHPSALSRTGGVSNGYRTAPSIRSMAMLSPAVVILDDADKMNLSNGDLEDLVTSSQLVILTANNATDDSVMDASFSRPARVDEFFTIVVSRDERRPPFDRLSDSEWAEVQNWPVAWQNEVAKRLRNRGSDLRLEDLRSRLTKRTRSGEVLK